jgi:hypothetical protein
LDFNHAFRQAEAFPRRHIKSRAVRAAEKRKLERQMTDVTRRFGRGTIYRDDPPAR